MKKIGFIGLGNMGQGMAKTFSTKALKLLSTQEIVKKSKIWKI